MKCNYAKKIYTLEGGYVCEKGKQGEMKKEYTVFKIKREEKRREKERKRKKGHTWTFKVGHESGLKAVFRHMTLVNKVRLVNYTTVDTLR